MKIDLHNYESVLIDYLDGALSAPERAEVELFLQQNPEIAEQISDFGAATLPEEWVSYDEKRALHLVSQSDADFEAWEADFPKLTSPLVSYPHKDKLLKRGLRRMPRWGWVAAAACLAVVVWTARELRITNYELGIGGEEELGITNYELRIEGTELAVLTTGEEELPQGVIPNEVREPKPQTTNHNPQSKIEEDVQPNELPVSPIGPSLALGMTPVNDLRIAEERVLAPKTELHLVSPFTPEETTRRERLQLAANDLIFDPLRAVIHTVARRFYERKTEVEMRLEGELPRFFAQNNPDL